MFPILQLLALFLKLLNVSFICSTLLQAEDWEKIMSLLPSVPESVPIEILKSAVLNACKRVDWIEAVIAVLAMTPAEKLCQLGADVSIVFCRR